LIMPHLEFGMLLFPKLLDPFVAPQQYIGVPWKRLKELRGLSIRLLVGVFYAQRHGM
jgi:hypothetical protein